MTLKINQTETFSYTELSLNSLLGETFITYSKFSTIIILLQEKSEGSPNVQVANMLDYNIVCEFEFHPNYYVHFRLIVLEKICSLWGLIERK